MREQGRRHWRRQWVIRPQGVLRVVGHTTWMVVPVAINQVHCWADSVVVVKRMHDRNAKPACDVRQVQTVPGEVTDVRSEEHTSELQSLMRTSYAVFCLKKNKISQTHQKLYMTP